MNSELGTEQDVDWNDFWKGLKWGLTLPVRDPGAFLIIVLAMAVSPFVKVKRWLL